LLNDRVIIRDNYLIIAKAGTWSFIQSRSQSQISEKLQAAMKSTKRSTRRSRDKWNRMLVVNTTAFIQPQPDEPSQQEQKNEVDESLVQEQDDVPQQKKQKNEAAESSEHDDDDVEELPTAKKHNGLQQIVDKIFTTAAEKKKKKLPPGAKPILVPPGKLGLSLKINKALGGATITKVDDSSIVNSVQVGDRIVSIDGYNITKVADLHVNNDKERIFGIITKEGQDADEAASKFKLLASLPVPVLSRPTSDKKFDAGNALRGNLQRELTEFRQSVGEPNTYDSLNSGMKYHLIAFPQRIKKGAAPVVDIKRGLKELMAMSYFDTNTTTQQKVDQMVAYLLSNHRTEFMASLDLREEALSRKKKKKKEDEENPVVARAYHVAATMNSKKSTKRKRKDDGTVPYNTDVS
jgi:hypothetical protein